MRGTHCSKVAASEFITSYSYDASIHLLHLLDPRPDSPIGGLILADKHDIEAALLRLRSLLTELAKTEALRAYAITHELGYEDKIKIISSHAMSLNLSHVGARTGREHDITNLTPIPSTTGRPSTPVKSQGRIGRGRSRPVTPRPLSMGTDNLDLFG
jgi:hypothetical protein